ncbi:MAG: hypothetical protein NBV68_04465 [Erythrobacter sp.]|uniref:hypothetical protein n=1 Tax=Erythrobacter sp. TaxID=1042 RepID=UPI0025D53D9E|nr:hypothetical protein [Erythrobacter sp.]MCL9998611.1 hypothetical protein [Erythrobacter sp.]
MARLLGYLALLPPVLLALIFGAQGIMWLVNPAVVVRFWGFALPEGGLGLSSMIGALASWCMTIAVCLVLALIRRQRIWYYPPMLMLGLFAVGRIVAGTAHGAPHLPERYGPELVFVGLLYLASRSTAGPREA